LAKRLIRMESLLAVVLAVSFSDFASAIMMFTRPDNSLSYIRTFLATIMLHCSEGNILNLNDTIVDCPATNLSYLYVATTLKLEA
jgi:hypothetical protein